MLAPPAVTVDTDDRRPPAGAPRLTLRLDRVEFGALAVFAAISVWVLAVEIWQVAAYGRVWTGTDGVYLVDQLQYLAWIQDASRHFLVSNLFVLRPTPADYFMPAIAISGGLTAIGIPAWVSLLLWKPVAVLGVFYAIRAYVVRLVGGRPAARVALVLALFFGSFTVVYGSVTSIGDLYLGFLSWGYVFALLALACLIAALVLHDRLRGASRLGWLPGGLGALASLLHPWHGELLIIIVVVAEAMMLASGLQPRRLALAAMTVTLTALPLVYYELLGRLDLSWRLARDASKHGFSLWSILLALVPLLIPALIACLRRPRSFLAATAPAWLLAALVVYAVSATGLAATPLHAFEGITIPLSVLAVQGFQRLGWSDLPHPRLAAAVLIAAFTIPAAANQLLNARQLVAYQPARASFIQRDERDALRFLADDREDGGVIARSYLGALVPGATGRHTLVGDCLWSEPNCAQRLVTVRNLFTGRMSAPEARGVVLQSGARFVLADCRPTVNLTRLLGPIVESLHTFGCARVYVVQ